MSHHPPAIFIADSHGLDFLNSIATPVDTPVDWIADGEGLMDWLAQAKYLPLLTPSGTVGVLGVRTRKSERLSIVRLLPFAPVRRRADTAWLRRYPAAIPCRR